MERKGKPMSKRVVIGLVVVVSLLVLFGRHASAATCIQYRVVGGTPYCTAWKTKGVLFEIKFDKACGSEGSACTAQVIAMSDDNVAFCENLTAGAPPIRVTNCSAALTFTGNTATTECVAKHEDRDPTGPGVGHEHHGCTATLALQRVGSCNPCCAGVQGSTGQCVDATPVEMLTQTEVFPVSSVSTLSAGGGSANCTGSSSCLIQELCSINPNKIVFIDENDPNFTGSREYQCNLQCVGEAGESNPRGCERIFPPDFD
jgi:hypothetical protein